MMEIIKTSDKNKREGENRSSLGVGSGGLRWYRGNEGDDGTGTEDKDNLLNKKESGEGYKRNRA